MNLTHLIKTINEQIRPIFEKYTGSVIYDDISSIATRDGKNIPVIIDKNGQAKFIGANDLNPFTLYHKSIALSIGRQNSDRGFGDTIDILSYVYSNTMICFLDRKKVCDFLPDEIVLLIQGQLKTLATVSPYRQILVRLTAANFNSGQIFSQEYPGAENKLKLEQVLFQISYTIEAIFDAACLPKCA